MKKKKMIVGIILIVFAVFATAMVCLTKIPMSSVALKLMYAERSLPGKWSARYFYFNGEDSETIQAEDTPYTLHITAETKAGDLALKLTGKDSGIVYQEGKLPTGSFDVELPESVTAALTANKHRGSFEIETVRR